MTEQKKPAAKPESTKPQAPAKPVPVAKPQAKPKAEASIYVGPSLQGGRLAQYSVFRGGELPPNVAALVREHETIKRLIVPVSKLAGVEARLRDRSSAEAAQFAEAAKIFSQGGV